MPDNSAAWEPPLLNLGKQGDVMNTHDLSKLKGQRVPRGLLVLLAIALGLTLAVSLANAGKSGAWGASELQLQNVDLQPRPVTTTFYAASGRPEPPITDLLAGGRSRFYSPTLPTGFTGTVSVDSPGQVLGVVTHIGDEGDDPPGAAQWPLIDDAELSNIAYVPRFFVPQTSGPASRLSIHNLASSNADIAMMFRDVQGQLYPRRINVPVSGTQFLDGAALDLSPGFKGSAVISTTGPIYVGVDRIDRSRSAFSAAHAPAHGGFEIAAPLFFQSGDPKSTLIVQNTNSTLSATGVLSYYATSGKLLTAQPFTIEPFATFEWPGMAGSAQSFTSGHVVATADQPIVGLVLGDSVQFLSMWDYTAVVAVPDKPDTLDRRAAYGPAAFYGYKGWTLSQVFIANLSSSPAFVDVEYSSALTGIVSPTQLIIPPHGLTETRLISPLSDFEHYSVSILSDQPIAAVVGVFNLGLVDQHMAYEAQYASTVRTHPPPRRVYLPSIMK